MKKMINTSMAYMIAGLCMGVFYREFTKFNAFTGKTVLKAIHPHLLALGMMMFLILGLFVYIFPKLKQNKCFKLFYIFYNIGLIGTVCMMAVRGISQVMMWDLARGLDFSISGLSGVFHIFLTAALILLFIALKKEAVEKNENKELQQN